MKFVQFTYANAPNDIRVGYVEGDTVVDLNKVDSSLPTSLLGILRNGDIEKVKKIQSSNPPAVALASVTLKAPITGVDKVLCMGLNYRDLCAAQGLPHPEKPFFFSKFASCIVGPDDAVRIRTGATEQVIWEVELTAVIGKEASCVRAADAYDYVFGYTIAQDISALDWLKQNGGQLLLAKSMDTFCPIGPWIVSAAAAGDPARLRVSCRVNGALKQSSCTDQLIHSIPDAIERLSSVMTLLPGDLILTGTPVNLLGADGFLKPGDVVESEIQGIGVLRTRVEVF